MTSVGNNFAMSLLSVVMPLWAKMAGMCGGHFEGEVRKLCFMLVSVVVLFLLCLVSVLLSTHLFYALCYVCVCVCVCLYVHVCICVCVGGGGAFVGRRLGSEAILCCSDVKGCVIPTTATKSVHFDSKTHCYAFRQAPALAPLIS